MYIYILSDLFLWSTLIHVHLFFWESGFVQCANSSEIHESREIPFVNRVIYQLMVETDYSPLSLSPKME